MSNCFILRTTCRPSSSDSESLSPDSCSAGNLASDATLWRDLVAASTIRTPRLGGNTHAQMPHGSTNLTMFATADGIAEDCSWMICCHSLLWTTVGRPSPLLGAARPQWPLEDPSVGPGSTLASPSLHLPDDMPLGIRVGVDPPKHATSTLGALQLGSKCLSPTVAPRRRPLHSTVSTLSGACKTNSLAAASLWSDWCPCKPFSFKFLLACAEERSWWFSFASSPAILCGAEDGVRFQCRREVVRGPRPRSHVRPEHSKALVLAAPQWWPRAAQGSGRHTRTRRQLWHKSAFPSWERRHSSQPPRSVAESPPATVPLSTHVLGR